jgi:hypothetical protein
MGGVCEGPRESRARTSAEKNAHGDISNLNPFSKRINQQERIKIRETLRDLRKYEILHRDRFEYLPQLLYWAL